MSGPPNRHGLFPLKNIPITDSFFLGVDPTGAFQFRTDVMDKGAGKAREEAPRVKERQLVAMGLTEVCCQIGRGKVGQTSRAYATLYFETTHVSQGVLFPYAVGDYGKAEGASGGAGTECVHLQSTPEAHLRTFHLG